MNPSDINVGDSLFVKAGFLSASSPRIAVMIIEKRPGNADGGFVFKTTPEVGSGHGLSAFWFEK